MTKEEFAAAALLSDAQADRWYVPVLNAMDEFSIDTPTRVAAYLAQVGHESGGFIHTKELWGPTPAQQRYEGRLDLGNTQPGDGKKYMGRGLIQITGRSNYAKVARGLGVDVLGNPQLLEQTDLAARSAAWWWQAHGCNGLAASGDFEALTRRINGGLNGYVDRMRRWKVARGVLGA
ncbi:chitinase [Bordetella genomosp. 9]|uniref:Chitinase n=1 Tax=Bordetella genomosp. 9 TaxID=1416803 RepID=A0A261RF13_9BORD|nr:glycoside hydrolase family 19 protein [Bordetella genomosp. 9]OZI23626.1 chitinase [Bordetella genomosp. 9]